MIHRCVGRNGALAHLATMARQVSASSRKGELASGGDEVMGSKSMTSTSFRRGQPPLLVVARHKTRQHDEATVLLRAAL